MNYRVDRGGRVAVACDDHGQDAAHRLCSELSAYKPPAAISELQTDIGFAAMNLQAMKLARPDHPQQMDLSVETRLRLRDADHLIVLCGAETAEDRFVDEEIRTFLAHQKNNNLGGRLHPVRVGLDGEAALPEAIVEHGTTLIADLRKSGDGWTKGMVLIRSAVLGVQADQLERLEQARDRKRAVNALILVGFVALAAGAAAILVPMMP